MITLPSIFLAALPTVCTRERSDLRKPSLSASNMATSATSGKSRPSLSRFTPTKISNNPPLKSCKISTRSRVSTSEWM